MQIMHHHSGDKAFSTTANVTSNAPGTIATDDFVFGSTQLANDTGTTDDDNRVFFDKSKKAFRAGSASDDSWDDANVGVGSVAFGTNNTASGIEAFAIGENTIASGYASVALGSR